MNLSKIEIELYPRGETPKLLKPLLKDGVKVHQSLGFNPSKMTFALLKDEWLSFNEGTLVNLKIDGKPFFEGYIFTKKRNKKGVIECTAYDQLRYLKTKTTMKIEKVGASELVNRVIKGSKLAIGEVEPSKKYPLPRYIAEDKEYLEILEYITSSHAIGTGEFFIFYDNAGKLDYKKLQSMRILDQVFDASQIEDFEYTTSIDNSYNSIAVDRYEENDEKIIETIIKEDKTNIGKWGLLRYNSKSTEPKAVINKKAESLLKMLNRVQRTLRLSKVIGNTKVRGGSLIMVKLNLGDMLLYNWMLVKNVTHIFEKGMHLMDLEVANQDLGFNEMSSVPNIFEFKQSKKENQEDGAIGKQGDGKSTGIYGWPTPAWRGIPTTYPNHTNKARDFPAPMGSPVVACDGGIVSIVQFTTKPIVHWSYGNMVKIDHGGGRTTLYAHMSRISVRKGQKVTKGQEIGRIGSTGNSTGPHLHLEIVEHGTGIDPNTRLRR